MFRNYCAFKICNCVYYDVLRKPPDRLGLSFWGERSELRGGGGGVVAEQDLLIGWTQSLAGESAAKRGSEKQ